MTNYITAQEFTSITGITGEEIGEIGSDGAIRDARITESQVQFETELNRSFSGTEDDYTLAQRAVAYLAAHNVWLQKVQFVPTTSAEMRYNQSPYIMEYRRVMKILREGRRVDTDDRPIFMGSMDTIETADISDD